MRLFLTISLLCALLIGSLFLERPHHRAELTSGYVSIETLDAQLTRAVDDVRLAYAFFEGLCTFNPYTFKVIPGVAERWELGEDGVTYTFHLRPDARWSNGDAVRASDFAYTWRLGLMPDTAPPYIEFLQFIRGGKAFTDWCQTEWKRIKQLPEGEQMAAGEHRVSQAENKFRELVGVEVLDDRTLRVQAERPTPYFLEIIASWPLMPLHPPTLARVTTLNPDTLMLRRDPMWTTPGTMVNNGPYLLADSRFRRYYRLRANPYYWAAGSVGPRTVDLISFSDWAAWFNGYSTGAVDVVFDCQNLSFAADLSAEQASGRREDLVEHDGFITYYYCFNTRPTLPGGGKNPFADKSVRRAFALAVDREAIVNQVTRLRQKVATVFIPPGSIDGYTSPRGIGYDPIAAKRALAEAGYPDGRGLPTIDLSYNAGAGHEDKAQAVGRMWRQTLGVQVDQAAVEWKVYLARRIAGDFMICRHAWGGDYGDPTTFLDIFRTGNGNNDAGYSNAHFDGLLDQAAAERDPAKRMAILSEAERFLIEDEVALCPVFHFKIIHAHVPWVQGINSHPRDLQFFHLMKVSNPVGAPALKRPFTLGPGPSTLIGR